MSKCAVRPYHTLVMKDLAHGWAPQFGHYNRRVVETERRAYVEDDMRMGVVNTYKIITTAPLQEAINGACVALNAAEKAAEEEG